MECISLSKTVSENIGDDITYAKSGNKEAFSELIDQHRTALYRVAKGILKSDFDAADAIQETIICAYRNIGKLKNYKVFKTWLIRILINECKRILRNTKRTIPIGEIEEQPVFDRYNSDIDISGLIGKLEPKFKYVIILHYYEDMGIKEMAAVLKIPQGTVKSRLLRARKKLQEMLTQKGDYHNEQ